MLRSVKDYIGRKSQNVLTGLSGLCCCVERGVLEEV